MNGISLSGIGYTGIGVTGQDVLIYGNLLVSSINDIELYATNNNITLNSLNANTVSNCSGFQINASDFITMTANTGAMDITAEDTITLTSVGLESIVLSAPNVNSYTYAMPICFTRERTDSFAYNFNGTGVAQTYEIVYSTDFNIPVEFVAESPPLGYTSTNWKIDFALNTWNNTVLNDKGIACYFVFEDQNGNFYLPITYNPNTPYAVYQPASTFTSQVSGLTFFQNYNWSDYVDLAGLVGGLSGILPLNLRLVFAGDNAFACKFSMTVSLTRTNIV
jgi:hypothetical protein